MRLVEDKQYAKPSSSEPQKDITITYGSCADMFMYKCNKICRVLIDGLHIFMHIATPSFETEK
jgi:hypothetical protein